MTLASNSAKVDDYLAKLDYPLKDCVVELRGIIVAAHPMVGEDIGWNAPLFNYLGPKAPFPKKEDRRYIVGFNFFKQDAIRMIFLRGSSVVEGADLLDGAYPDGRRLLTVRSLEDLQSKQAAIESYVRQLATLIEKEG